MAGAVFRPFGLQQVACFWRVFQRAQKFACEEQIIMIGNNHGLVGTASLAPLNRLLQQGTTAQRNKRLGESLAGSRPKDVCQRHLKVRRRSAS